MKGVILEGPRKLTYGEYMDPVLNDNGVLIKVAYCGICGSDIHKYEGQKTIRPLTFPVLLGHEISGVVCQVGKDVTGFKVGDRITADPNYACKECFYCQKGQFNFCENSKGVVKGMAEYVQVPEANVYHLPDSLSLKDAALSEPLSCCLHGIKKLELEKDENVAIIGLGAIGTIMAEVIKNTSSNIMVIDTDESKRDKAKELGIRLFVNPLNEDIKQTMEDNGFKHTQKFIECVGSPKTLNMAIDIADNCSTIVLFGLYNGMAEFDYGALIHKELELKAAMLNPSTMNQAIELLAEHKLDTDMIISKIIKPSEVIEEFEKREFLSKGKVLVEF